MLARQNASPCSGWMYSTNITQTVLGPNQGITVTLTITPPCGLSKEIWLTPQGTLDTGRASGPVTIDVEGSSMVNYSEVSRCRSKPHRPSG